MALASPVPLQRAPQHGPCLRWGFGLLWFGPQSHSRGLLRIPGFRGFPLFSGLTPPSPARSLVPFPPAGPLVLQGVPGPRPVGYSLPPPHLPGEPDAVTPVQLTLPLQAILPWPCPHFPAGGGLHSGTLGLCPEGNHLPDLCGSGLDQCQHSWVLSFSYWDVGPTTGLGEPPLLDTSRPGRHNLLTLSRGLPTLGLG